MSDWLLVACFFCVCLLLGCLILIRFGGDCCLVVWWLVLFVCWLDVACTTGCMAFTQCTAPKLMCTQWQVTHCTQWQVTHSTQWQLHTAHSDNYTLHTVTSYCTQWQLHTAHSDKLHTAHSDKLHTAHSDKLHTAHSDSYTLHTVTITHCTQWHVTAHSDSYTLHTVTVTHCTHWQLHTAHSDKLLHTVTVTHCTQWQLHT